MDGPIIKCCFACVRYILDNTISQITNHTDAHPWVEVGANITFSCKNDHLFEDDPDLTNIYAECLGNGSFINHLPWKKCLNMKTRYVEMKYVHLLVQRLIFTGPTLFCATGLVKFVPAVARLFCPALPGSFLNVLCEE